MSKGRISSISRNLRGLLLASSASALSALLAPGFAGASTIGTCGGDALTLSPVAEQQPAGDAVETATPKYMADAPPEAPNIHGFFSMPFGTSYTTPRGLVVENAGVVIQPVVGLVIPLGDMGVVKDVAFVGGIWNSINSAQGDTNVGPWNEMDVFFSLGGKIADFSGTLTYGAWNFPQSTATAKPSTEHNIDLKIQYDDTKVLGDFALHPYVDFFWAVGGSSTVVLGKEGDTGYAEIGIVPSYKFTGIENYPITFKFPTYFSVGPEGYWGRDVDALTAPDGNLGLFSTAINASVPLAFIPTKYGFWHADFGVQYYYLINDTLLRAGTLLSGNTDENVFRGYVGFGVDF